MPKTLTVKEACEELRVTEQTVWRYIREGRLSAAKVGRQYLIPESEIEALKTPPERSPPSGTANA